MNNGTVKFIVNTGVIAALYAVLTLLLAPVSFGVVQVRISEALCVLGLFTPSAIPGLTIGCFIANLLGPNGIVDALLGALASLVGALGMYFLRKKMYLAPLVNVVSNGVIIGLMLHYYYGEAIAPIVCILLVAFEEAVALYLLGMPLAKVISSRPELLDNLSK